MALPIVQLDTWSLESSPKHLKRRLDAAKAAKVTLGLPEQWARNLEVAYTAEPAVESGVPGHAGTGGADAGVTLGATQTTAGAGGGSPIRASMGLNLTLKNVRLLHSQLSSNPPTCVPRPATSDQEDRRAAKGADRVMRHSLRAYKLQERTDQVTLSTLLRGIGVLKCWWDPSRGDVLRVGKDGKSLVLTGDMGFKVVSPDKFFPDPRAKADTDVAYVVEEVDVTREDFLVRFPDHRDCLKRARAEAAGGTETLQPGAVLNSTGTSLGATDGDDEVESLTVYEYWETGLPSNGYAGRFAVFLADGTLLVPPQNSPHAFRARPTIRDLQESRQEGKKLRRRPAKARLPYGWLTDIDVPETIWGKSAVEFAGPLQDLSNRLASTTLANLQAHSVMRLLVDDGADVTSNTWTNDPYVVTKVKKKNQGVPDPKFLQPGQLPAAHSEMVAYVERGVSDMFGTNESMFGVQSRQTSGYSMEYSVNQGNLIRRRLFNKYVLFTEWMYQTILDLVIKHWTADRTVEVLGKEKSFELIDLRGSDIVGGYSLVVEYGTSLSLDPATRRDEILRLRDVLLAGGVSNKTIVSMLRLGDLDSITDATDMASDRAREVVEAIVASDTEVKPNEFEDHESMLAYFLMYVMTKEFKALAVDDQSLIRDHIRLRFQQARTDKTTMASGQAGGESTDQAAEGGATATTPTSGGVPPVGPLAGAPGPSPLPVGATAVGPGAGPQT